MPLRPCAILVIDEDGWWAEQMARRLANAPVRIWWSVFSSPLSSLCGASGMDAVLAVVPRDVEPPFIIRRIAELRVRFPAACLLVQLPLRHRGAVTQLRQLWVDRIWIPPATPPDLEAYLRRFCADRRAAHVGPHVNLQRPPVHAIPVDPDDRTLPQLDDLRCIASGRCVRLCPTDCFSMSPSGPRLERPDRCIRCGLCVLVCPTEALSMPEPDQGNPTMQKVRSPRAKRG